MLAINGKVLTRISDLDVMHDSEELQVTIVRNKEEMELTVPIVSTEDLDTDRIIMWCGAILHRPHHAVRQQIKKIHSKVYVSWRVEGSPADQYSINATNFITHVNGIATPNLDKFLKVASIIPEDTYVQLRVVTFDNVPYAWSIKTNYHYFPTYELVRENSKTREWKSYRYENGARVSD